MESLDWSKIILNCLITSLKICLDEDILIAGQHSLLMLMERIESIFRENEVQIQDFYERSLQALPDLSYKGQASTLEFAGKLVSQLGNNDTKQQQLDLVSLALKVNLVHQGSNSRGQIARKAISKFFKDLLQSKNILVLQEAYAALVQPFKVKLLNILISGDVYIW